MLTTDVLVAITSEQRSTEYGRQTKMGSPLGQGKVEAECIFHSSRSSKYTSQGTADARSQLKAAGFYRSEGSRQGEQCKRLKVGGWRFLIAMGRVLLSQRC